MPNTPVRAAATGLPTIRPDRHEIMVLAHDYAREMPARLAYADRLRRALQRAWRDERAALMSELREMVEDRVERLLAFLDALDGDENLEPSHGSYDARKCEPDAEHDPTDDEFSLGSVAVHADEDQTHWCQGKGGDVEADELGPMAPATYTIASEEEATRRACSEASRQISAKYWTKRLAVTAN